MQQIKGLKYAATFRNSCQARWVCPNKQDGCVLISQKQFYGNFHYHLVQIRVKVFDRVILMALSHYGVAFCTTGVLH